LLVLPGAEEPTPARAVCLLSAGRLATLLGSFETARTYFEAGLPLAGTIDDPWVQWVGPQNFALYTWMCGDLDSAIRFQREALAIARGAGDRIDEAISLGVSAGIALSQGDYAEAQRLAADARNIAHAVGEEWAESLAVVRLGLLALQRGERAIGKVDLEHGLNMCRQQRNPYYVWQALEGLGRVAMVEGHHDEAYACFAESLQILDEIGHRPGIADTLESLAAFAARLSKPELALQTAGAAAALREGIGFPRSPMRQELLEGWLPALQLSIGADLSAQCWAIGKALPTQEAIDLALTTLESVVLVSQRPKEVSAHVAGLTTREAEVLRLVAQGQSNKEIAAELVLSVRTVERHITNLYGKIDARGKADATAYAIHHGLA
jgi:ATP/maltotriose-dependent transcriptional regulator MalT